MQDNAEQAADEHHRVEPGEAGLGEGAKRQPVCEPLAKRQGDHEAAEAEEEIDRQIAAGHVPQRNMKQHDRDRRNAAQSVEGDKAIG